LNDDILLRMLPGRLFRLEARRAPSPEQAARR